MYAFFLLIKDGRVTSTALVHVDDIFAVGQKERCDRLCVDLNGMIPVKNRGELKWYGGCRYSKDRKRGIGTVSVVKELPISSPANRTSPTSAAAEKSPVVGLATLEFVSLSLGKDVIGVQATGLQ